MSGETCFLGIKKPEAKFISIYNGNKKLPDDY